MKCPSLLAGLLVVFFYSFDVQFSVAQFIDPVPPVTTERTHVDSLCKAHCGFDQSSEVTANYEYEADFPTNQTKETNRTFGAYAVVNWNDSDSDGADKYGNPQTRDADDTSVSGNGRTHEIDLIKLTIKFPAHYKPEFLHMGAWVTAEPWKMKLTKSYGLKLWKTNKKETEWTEFEIHTAGAEETIYVEVTQVSAQMSDMWIKVSHTYHADGGAGVVKEEFDRIAVTGIWADLVEAKKDMSPQIEIMSVDNANNKLRLHAAGAVAPPGAPSVGDLVAIFDDKNTYIKDATGAVRDGDDQALKYGLFRVKSIANGLYEFERASIYTPAPFPTWVNVSDKVAVVGFPKIDDAVFLDVIHQNKAKGGMQRRSPQMAASIFFKFQVKPSGITWKKLSDGKKAIFDITRQTRYAKRFFLDGQWISGSEGEEDWPSTDEKPNDDISGDDEDCITPANNQHDFLYSYDVPGYPKNARDKWSFVYRANFREFVRVSFVDSTTNNSSTYWGANTTKGSRCSDRIQWCFAINAMYDKDAIDSAPALALHKHLWKYRTKYDKLDGTEEASDPLDSITAHSASYWPLNNPPTEEVADNATYIDKNFQDSEISIVNNYEIRR